MNMPGFTADVSLNRFAGNHHMGEVFGSSDGTIEPAIGRNNCYWDCLRNCDDDPYYCSVNCRCFCKGGPPLCEYQ